MAFVRRAVAPDALRDACYIADATQITVYDADFPAEAGQQFVQAVVQNARGGEETIDLTSMDWRSLNEAIEQEAEYHNETVKFVLDLGEPTDIVTLKLEIENYYDGDVVQTTVETVAPAPPHRGDEDAYSDWTYDWIYQHTGTGRTEGDSAYFVTVTESSDPALKGKEFEWGT